MGEIPVGELPIERLATRDQRIAARFLDECPQGVKRNGPLQVQVELDLGHGVVEGHGRRLEEALISSSARYVRVG